MANGSIRSLDKVFCWSLSTMQRSMLALLLHLLRRIARWRWRKLLQAIELDAGNEILQQEASRLTDLYWEYTHEFLSTRRPLNEIDSAECAARIQTGLALTTFAGCVIKHTFFFSSFSQSTARDPTRSVQIARAWKHLESQPEAAKETETGEQENKAEKTAGNTSETRRAKLRNQISRAKIRQSVVKRHIHRR